MCSICNKRIVDRCDKDKGEDAVYCEGKCNSWVHRQCAGLTQPCFKLISESKAPFLCVYCLLIQQASQINQLQNTVNNLTAQISELVGSRSSRITEASTPVAKANECMETSNDLPASNKKSLKTQIISEASNDRKFNVIVFGVPECKSETTRLEHLAKDSSSVISIFQKINSNLNESAVRDCFRLGRFNQSRD